MIIGETNLEFMEDCSCCVDSPCKELGEMTNDDFFNIYYYSKKIRDPYIWCIDWKVLWVAALVRVENLRLVPSNNELKHVIDNDLSERGVL